MDIMTVGIRSQGLDATAVMMMARQRRNNCSVEVVYIQSYTIE